MTSQSPRIYTYKITFEEVPYYYYGVKKEEYYNQKYWGSPVTNKWCWEFYTPKKQILEIFNYSEDGYKECLAIEARLIKPVLDDPWCLNENVSGYMSLEVRRKAAAIAGKISASPGGSFYENNHIYGKIAMSPGGHLYENRAEYGKLGGKKVKELGLGIFSLTTEERSQLARKHYYEGKGFATLSKEQRQELGSINGKKSGLTHKLNKTGICGMSKEQLSKNAAINNKQKWVCPVCGYTNIARYVNKHMKEDHNLPSSSKFKLLE